MNMIDDNIYRERRDHLATALVNMTFAKTPVERNKLVLEIIDDITSLLYMGYTMWDIKSFTHQVHRSTIEYLSKQGFKLADL